MSLSASRDRVSQKRIVSSLLAGHVVKRQKQGDGQLQEAAIQLLEQQQDLCSLFKEIGNPDPSNPFNTDKAEQMNQTEGISFTITGSLLVCGLRQQAGQLGVPLVTLSVKFVLERLKGITGIEGDKTREVLTASQRVQLGVLLESTRELIIHGALCRKGLWQGYMNDQKLPNLHVVYLLQCYNILKLKDILESDEGVRLWLVPQLKALCCWTPPQEEKEAMQTQQKVLSAILGSLVDVGFQSSQEQAAVEKKCVLLCISALDDMLFWLLDTADINSAQESSETATERWCQLFVTSLCDISASPDALQRFFMHSLTQTLAYKPQLAVSDAIALQNKWIFANTSPLLTSLFRKLTVVFSMEQLMHHLQQVLETHEISWKHVLCFLSTLLVYNPSAQPSLRALLSRLLTSAFDGYDSESMITAFLLARQGALQGPAIFPSYSDWFKESFGMASGFHATSKKSLGFLLKFLSDLVPFEPSQYLKVHIIHPPYVPVKYRSLLMEYVSLAKTRLADLKRSVENTGLFQDISSAGDAPSLCQEVKDVEKACSLFESTGKISATVMEASIFRRTYFLSRFLPALLRPRVLPVKADGQMSFIEALKRADKIPATQYSSYMESCQRLRQQTRISLHEENHDDPLHVLKLQLQEQRKLVLNGNDGDMSAHLSKISNTLSFIFPGLPDDPLEKNIIQLKTDMLSLPELHLQVVDLVLKSFCQCILDASKAHPPNKQNMWASKFVCVLVCNTQFLSCLLQRLWHLLHNQGSVLSDLHIIGLAAFLVHLHTSMSQSPGVQLISQRQPNPVSVSEALSSALVCNTRTRMHFCIRFCVAAMCYGICRGDSLPQQDDLTPNCLYKKLQYLIPRLLPEARRPVSYGKGDQEVNCIGLLCNEKDTTTRWKKTALYLWRHPAFSRLQHEPQYQLFFSEWLANELQVDRTKDTFSDSERLEYHQWVCLHLYLTRPEKQGGCGGSMKSLCSHLITAIMDQQQSEPCQGDHRLSQKGTCFPDILCILQEVIYEIELTNLSGSHPSRTDKCDWLFELVSPRFSSSLSSDSARLSCEHTLNIWNRIMLALPSVSFVKVKAEGDRMFLDCKKLIQHVNNHQRSVCSPSGFLSLQLTSHFLRSVLCVTSRCSLVAEEFNKAWCQITNQCPLLLVSTVYWWEQLSEVLLSLWSRLRDGETPPKQLQLIVNSQNWACGLMRGQLLHLPSAPALLLASSLYVSLQGRAEGKQCVSDALTAWQPERDIKHREVLTFLFFLCVNNYLSALLYPQEHCHQKALRLCTEVLTVLVDSADWLLIFKSNDAEKGAYHSFPLVMSNRFDHLMPWVFYSLLLQQSPELQQRAARCLGFLSTAVSCYISLLQLFLDGSSVIATLGSQMQSGQILSRTKIFLLRAISQMPTSTLFSRHIMQLKSLCVDLDPEVAAALSAHLDIPDHPFL
ncbi:Fanconi anemia group A protein isoform X2 [Hippocampus zosterae]|uniref:Fanconi anemia group A protein isoform X2 n=1 Tax=Hippocampus zosterae TaxID=109293 RepID=UPI00223E19FD|nr:Fanconi anemia group A protein isoform X2 [Hippocampus zosterae]